VAARLRLRKMLLGWWALFCLRALILTFPSDLPLSLAAQGITTRV